MEEEISNELKECPFCAQKINIRAKKCPFCHEILDPILIRLEAQHIKPVQKKRINYILFGIFLGGLGIHNFYAGYHGRGLVQLLLSILLWWTFVCPIAVGIWVIIELFTVTKDAGGIDFE